MRRIFALLIFSLLLPCALANAQQEPQLAAFEVLLDKVLAEQTVLLNCSALDANAFNAINNVNWQEERAETAKILGLADVPPGVLDDFQARTAPEAIVLVDAKFSELIEMCQAAPDWQGQFERLEFTQMSVETRKIFGIQ